jgi:hypothetical protein
VDEDRQHVSQGEEPGRPAITNSNRNGADLQNGQRGRLAMLVLAAQSHLKIFRGQKGASSSLTTTGIGCLALTWPQKVLKSANGPED